MHKYRRKRKRYNLLLLLFFPFAAHSFVRPVRIFRSLDEGEFPTHSNNNSIGLNVSLGIIESTASHSISCLEFGDAFSLIVSLIIELVGASISFYQMYNNKMNSKDIHEHYSLTPAHTQMSAGRERKKIC